MRPWVVDSACQFGDKAAVIREPRFECLAGCMVRPRFQSNAFVSIGPASGLLTILRRARAELRLTLRVNALPADRVAVFRVCCQTFRESSGRFAESIIRKVPFTKLTHHGQTV